LGDFVHPKDFISPQFVVWNNFCKYNLNPTFINLKINAMNYIKLLTAALTATAIMTGFMIFAPVIGLPKMDVGTLLGEMFGGSKVVGWTVHVVIGLIMLLPYAFFFNHWIPVENKFARGAIYGILVFVFSEIVFFIVNFTGHLTSPDKEHMAMMVFGNALACMVYGTVLGAFFERKEKDGMEMAKGNA
jgi:hypothetical protein